MRSSRDTKSQNIKKIKLIRRRRKLVGDSIKAPTKPTKSNIRTRKSKKSRVSLPSTFKISESYIKSQIDGLIIRKTVVKKRKIKQVTVTSAQEHPITETVQAILAEPQAPIPSPLPVLEAEPTPDEIPPEEEADDSEPIQEPTESFIAAPSSLTTEDSATEFESTHEVETAVATLPEPVFTLAPLTLEEPNIHLSVAEHDVLETIPIHIISVNPEAVTPLTPVVAESKPRKQHVLLRAFKFFIKIFTEFAKPDPRHHVKA